MSYGLDRLRAGISLQSTLAKQTECGIESIPTMGARIFGIGASCLFLQAADLIERMLHGLNGAPRPQMKKPRLGENRGLGFWSRWHLYC